MYKEIAKLILYRDLGEDSILLKLGGIFEDFELEQLSDLYPSDQRKLFQHDQ